MTPALHTPFLAVPQEVQAFANEQGVAAYLPAVLEMTARVFPGGLQEIIVEDDPEIANDRHIVVVVKARDLDVEQGVEAHGRWHQELSACCPAPLVYPFRLSLSIAP